MCVFLFHFSVHWNRRHDLRDSIDNNCSNYRLCEINVIYFTRGGIKVAFQSELTRQFESVKGDGKLFTILFYSESSIERQCLQFFFRVEWKGFAGFKAKMSCWVSTIATVIVGFQFITKVLPWIYENIIGPMILGPKINFSTYGWACKWNISLSVFAEYLYLWTLATANCITNLCLFSDYYQWHTALISRHCSRFSHPKSNACRISTSTSDHLSHSLRECDVIRYLELIRFSYDHNNNLINNLCSDFDFDSDFNGTVAIQLYTTCAYYLKLNSQFVCIEQGASSEKT